MMKEHLFISGKNLKKMLTLDKIRQINTYKSKILLNQHQMFRGDFIYYYRGYFIPDFSEDRVLYF